MMHVTFTPETQVLSVIPDAYIAFFSHHQFMPNSAAFDTPCTATVSVCLPCGCGLGGRCAPDEPPAVLRLLQDVHHRAHVHAYLVAFGGRVAPDRRVRHPWGGGFQEHALEQFVMLLLINGRRRLNTHLRQKQHLYHLRPRRRPASPGRGRGTRPSACPPSPPATSLSGAQLPVSQGTPTGVRPTDCR